jgi:hypothetical protein
MGFVDIKWLYEKQALKNLETGSKEYQREKVASLKWKRDIMRTILCNTFAPITQIHIRVIQTNDDKYSFELIDGQQRVTAILDFLNGKYTLPEGLFTYDKIDVGGASVNTLKTKFPAVYDRIEKYRIPAAWYENLDESQVSDLFINVLNNTNAMNHQEMRNAVRGQFTTWVRNHSRFENVHKLFTRITKAAKKKEKTYLQYMPRLDLKDRMEVDEWLTQLIHMYENSMKDGVRSQPALTQWVKDIQSNTGFASITSSKFKQYNKQWNLFLDFAHKVLANVDTHYVTTKLTPMSAQVLILYAHETEKIGGFKIRDMKQFTKQYFAVIDKWSDQSTKLYSPYTQLNGTQMGPMTDLFGGKNPNAMGTIKWILDREFTSNPERWGVIKIDTRESFSRNDIYQKWIEQDKKCYYTGREITQDELVGDHIIPRNAGVAQGGVTEYFNLAVTDSATNTAKSQLSAEDFQKRINIQMSAYA